MAKKKSLNIDFKQFFLNYGDRIGVGIAGIFILLLLAYSFIGPEKSLSSDQIRDQRDKARQALINFPVKKEELEPKEVKSVEEIAKLSESMKKPVPFGTLATMFPFQYVPPGQDNFRSNPEVFAALALKAAPVLMAYKVYDIEGDKVIVLEPLKEGLNLKGDKNKNNQLRDGGGGPNMPSGGMGVSRDKGKQNQGNKNDTTSSVPKDAMYKKRRINLNELGDELVAINIMPTRAAYVVGIYPYGKQLDELSRALKMEKSQIESYYKGLDIQRREIIPQGTRMRDGSYAKEDMVMVKDPKNPASMIPVPLSSVPQNPVKDDEMAAAGWINVDKKLLGQMVKYAVETYEEPDNILRSLLALSDRLVQRIPKPLRSDYPNLTNELKDLEELVEKIRKDNTPIPPPKKNKFMDKSDDGFGNIGGSTNSSSSTQSSGGGGSGTAGLSDPPGGGGSGSRGVGGSQGSGEKSKVDLSKLSYVPDYCVIRFLDLTLDSESVGGRTFEYRIKVVMDNPNFGSDMVAVPEFANIRELYGPWSPVCRVTFPNDEYIYTSERRRPRPNSPDLDSDRVPIQLHKWLGFVEPTVNSQDEMERVGDWWVDYIHAARGEYIGRVPTAKENGETSLIFWLSYMAAGGDANKLGMESLVKVNTPNLLTRYLLADFEGGHRERLKKLDGRGTWEEDVPAELLIVEPNGRMIARTLLTDRVDETRKKRFERFEQWFNTIKEKAERQKPKEKEEEKKK